MATKRKHASDSESSEDLDKSQRGFESDEEGGVRVDDIYIPPPPRPPGTIDTTGPRLIITQIVNTNFKSYGGEQVLSNFHKNFNAIVGPNGSGKSNVIDSMLFVFGYRASKIRSKKMSVLIHKSAKYPNVQSCTVAVHFTLINDKEDDPDAYEEVPNNRFVVSRTVHKDNSSYYLLNDKKVQFKEVGAMLRKYGIDLDHNRFLILQGEVEQISLMKPKAQTEHETGMLEYLEDIIGTTRFKEPLLQIDEKIEILSQLREEKLKRVQLAEKEKDALREPMQEAVQFLEIENEVTKKRNFLYQRQIKQLNYKVTDNEARKEVLLEKEAEMKQSLKTLAEEKKTKESVFTERNKKFEGLIKRKEDLTEAFDKANNTDINLQAEFQEINKRRKKVIESIKEETAKLADLEKVPERNKAKIEEFGDRENQLSTQCESLQAEKEKLLTTVRDETLGLQEKKEKIQTELIGLKHVADDTKQAFNLAESELKLFMSNEQNEKRKLETLKTAYEETKQKFTDRSKSLKEVKQRLPTVEKQYKDAIANLDRVKIEEARTIHELKTQRVQVEETRSSMQATKSRGRVLDSLTQQKSEGNLPGLFGRLGDLGAIDQKYDVAISTACGPLDNIVVDKVDTAQWCIEFLKQHNIGRATFIALDKQEHLRKYANSKINTPENVPRLYDLIKVDDDRVRTAFYFALRDTLVAHDIDQGTRIAFGEKRFRVVSLKGDLIETSGTMSGGGRSVSRGRMGQQVAVQNKIMSPQKIRDLESSLEKLEQKARELHERQRVLEDEVNRLQPELRSLKTDLEKFTIELQSLKQQQPNLEKQIKNQELKVKESCVNPAQLKKIQATVDDKKKEYEKANSNSEVLQRKVDEISKEIKDKIDKKMKPVTSKLKESTTLLEKVKAELIKLRVAIKTSERNSKKSTDKINSLEQEKTEAENKLHAIQKKRKEIEVDAAKLMEIIEKITEEFGEQGAFEEQQKEISELNKKLNKLKSDKIEVDQKINEFSNIIRDAKDSLIRFQKRLSELQLHEIPEQTIEELKKYTDEELEETDTRHMEIELKREEEEIKSARPNLTAIQEFRKKEAHYIERVNELEEATQKRKQMKDLREDLRKKRQKEFHAGFNLISTKLKEMYQLITLGGDAELEMVDSYDPFAEGIVLNVRPPKKSWKNITNLSGGEKTLSSLALVFALHYYKPSPLYFMDEIDAALDFKNVSIVGNYIKERTKNAQFIIISLRSNMFELADHLIGIFKIHNITNSVTVNPRHFSDEVPKNDVRVLSQVPATNPNNLTPLSNPASLFDSSHTTAVDSTANATRGTESSQSGIEITQNGTETSQSGVENTQKDMETHKENIQNSARSSQSGSGNTRNTSQSGVKNIQNGAENSQNGTKKNTQNVVNGICGGENGSKSNSNSQESMDVDT